MGRSTQKRKALIKGVKDDFYDLIHFINSWRFWQTVVVMTVGLALVSLGINAVILPNQLISGGATGLAIALFYIFQTPPISVIYWLINVPILLLGWRYMSLRFVTLALIGVSITAVTMELTSGMVIPTSDKFMAALLAGMLTGGGVGIYLRFGGSAGGVDILAAVLRRQFGISMGTTFMTINSINFIWGGILFKNLDIAFYTALSMAFHSRVLEWVQMGFLQRKAAMIITAHPEEIAGEIIKRLNRGVTFLQGSKGMSQTPTKVVYTVVNTVEWARLKEIIFHYDPHAFVAVNDSAEVIGGYRFGTWGEAGYGRGMAHVSQQDEVRS